MSYVACGPRWLAAEQAWPASRQEFVKGLYLGARLKSQLHFVSAFVLTVACLSTFGPVQNEHDVLPFARQFVDSSWLANDWYLTRQIPYRTAFNLIAGPVVTLFGFEVGAIVGRVATWALFAFAYQHLAKTTELDPWSGLLFVAGFVCWPMQDVVAYEEMVRTGWEAKTIAYPFVLFALSFAIRRRFLFMWAALGAALSFHALVGVYAAFCLGIMLVTEREARGRAREILKSAWPCVLTGAFGLVAIVKAALQPTSVRAAEIYVLGRVPHHVYPEVWGDDWYWGLLGWIGVAIVAFVIGRPSTKALARFAFASAALFAIGLAVYAMGSIELARFYWFRFGDVMLPFCGWWFAALAVATIPKRTHRLLLPILLAAFVVIDHSGRSLVVGHTRQRPLFEWIRNNTPPDATFLVDPGLQDFYVRAERARVVGFKHAPQPSEDLVEWFDRMTAMNTGLQPLGQGFQMVGEVRRNYDALPAEKIRTLAKRYGATHYVGPRRSDIDLRLIHTAGGYAVYAVGAP